MRKPLLFVLALLLSFSVFLVGCGSSSSQSTGAGKEPAPAPTPQTPKEGQDFKGTGQVTVYTAFLEDEAARIFGEFEKTSGIKVKFVRLSAGEIQTRLKAEKNNPQASVWFGGSTDTFISAAGDGLLEKFTPKGSDKLPKEYVDKDSNWTPVSIGAIAFASNTDWLAKNNLQPPQSWEDLLKPEFKGNVTMAHPATSGTSFTTLATLIQLKGGEDQGFQYFEKLDKNIRQYTKSGAAPVRMAGLGETGVGICFTQDILSTKEQGFPITMSFPKEGTGYEVSAAALIKSGPAGEVENAKKFIEWSISKGAQDLLKDSFRLPVNPEAVLAKGALKLSDIKVISYNAQWAGEHRSDLLGKFDSKIKGKESAK
ncbi:ABC transporter substrate-binding protein [Paenibacillus radicis (ex Xue et al. 2023)]|uniref:ABC transporter substrate-binding protein n=1 Tax=Paenibacillus radicis (ex Xue et al. 2023) TaxID=2972489 RepID=A0ABT1YHI9_9BACL|nr:ABC transporter substrate-binding protein [Paenibacillus radicis (ex Xue et al. 2023)]MCR8632665.1 ABC transporter substrate-binding protein [Paenibacillus radicis (ex Xue et al. 2023)]